VAEKIDVDGLVGAGADFRELVAQAVRREHRTGQRAEPAPFAHRRGQLEVHGAGHRSQHDRMRGAEQLDQTGIGPHALFLLIGGSGRAVSVELNGKRAAPSMRELRCGEFDGRP
jgi:hypothetical protein